MARKAKPTANVEFLEYGDSFRIFRISYRFTAKNGRTWKTESYKASREVAEKVMTDMQNIPDMFSEVRLSTIIVSNTLSLEN